MSGRLQSLALGMVSALFVLASGCSTFHRAPAPNIEDLQRLYDNHEWFKLNAAVRRGPVPLFFRAAMECALNQTDACERDTSDVIRTNPGTNVEYEAHSLLESLYLRQGKYQHALKETESILILRPNDAAAQNSSALLKAASASPEQQIAHFAPANVPWADPGKSLTIPISVDGKPVKYPFDTGANLSVISDGDAKRLGLVVHDANLNVAGSAGQQGRFRIASAGHLQIGDLDVENVAFLVFPAGQPPFDASPPLEQGLIGLPPLLAAKQLSWSPSAGLSLGAGHQENENIPPNIVFDGANIIASAVFQHATVMFLVDSGSEWTFMYPRFAKDHDAYLNAHGTKTKHKFMGFGGEVNADVLRLPELSFVIGRNTDRIPNVNVLLQYTDQNSKLFDGTIGQDTMLGPRSFDIDFDTMILTLR
jgi:hypothetical protein